MHKKEFLSLDHIYLKICMSSWTLSLHSLGQKSPVKMVFCQTEILLSTSILIMYIAVRTENQTISMGQHSSQELKTLIQQLHKEWKENGDEICQEMK